MTALQRQYQSHQVKGVWESARSRGPHGPHEFRNLARRSAAGPLADSHTGRRANAYRSLSHHDPKNDGADLAPWIAAASESLIASLASGGHKKHRRGLCCAGPAVVGRPDRRPDHQAQAGQATDVRQSKDRSPSGKIDQRDLSRGKYHRDCVRAPVRCRNTKRPPACLRHANTALSIAHSWFSDDGTGGCVTLRRRGDFQNTLALAKREYALRARLSNF